jgi:predicted enzyme related to lactoylglutathione lyase
MAGAEKGEGPPSDRLVVVVLHASDFERSADFYRRVVGIPLASGANEPQGDLWIGGAHAEISWFDGAYLHFAVVPALPPQRPVTTGVQIGFRVPDLDAVHGRALEAGVPVLHPPRDEPWGRTARYLDPDGNVAGVAAAAIPAGYHDRKRREG